MKDYYLCVEDKQEHEQKVIESLSDLSSDSRVILLMGKQKNYNSIDLPEKELAYYEFITADQGVHVFDFLKTRSLLAPECHFSFYLNNASRYRIYLYLCSYISVYRISEHTYRVIISLPTASVREVNAWMDVASSTFSCSADNLLDEITLVLKNHINAACFQFDGLSKLASVIK